jgi:hypothetical protein
MRRLIVLALTTTLLAFAFAAAASASGGGQWWHHTLPNDKVTCNQSDSTPNTADAGPFDSKDACLAWDPGGGGGDSPTWAISLSVSPNPDSPGGDLTFSGVLTKDGGSAGTSGQAVEIVEYNDAACTSLMGDVIGGTTGAGGSYSILLTTVTTVPGDYFVDAESNGARSSCVDVTISGAGEGGGTLTPLPPPPSGMFLCYSTFETDGGQFFADQGVALAVLANPSGVGWVKAWTPYAVLGATDPATSPQISGYHLVCNLPAGMSPTGQWLYADNGASAPEIAPFGWSVSGSAAYQIAK